MKQPDQNVAPLGAFDDKAAAPTDAALRRTLGGAAAAWRTLIARTGSRHGPVVEQWSFAGARFGWSLRLQRQARVLLYLIPQEDRFLVGIVLGGKAVAAAKSARLPAAVQKAIAEAPVYGEGTGLRLAVAGEADLAPIERLLDLKVSTTTR
jgi:hypothetical protein